MKNLVWKHKMDIGRVFPQTFDVSDTMSNEFKDFKEDFKFTFIASYLKKIKREPAKFIKTEFDKVILTIAIAERRIKVLGGRLLDDIQNTKSFFSHELDSVTDAMWGFLAKTKMDIDLFQLESYRALKQRFQNVKTAEIKAQVSALLN